MLSPMRNALVAVVLAMLASTPVAALAADGKVQILWLGQAPTRITTPTGKVIVIDPFLTTNPKTPPEYKNLDKIGRMDMILVTHAHGDHLGDGPDLAKKCNAPLWGPAGLDQSLQTLGVLAAALEPRFNKGGTIQPIPAVKITAVHAGHSSELQHAIPIHCGTTPQLAGTPDEHLRALGTTTTKVHDMKPGDTIEF